MRDFISFRSSEDVMEDVMEDVVKDVVKDVKEMQEKVQEQIMEKKLKGNSMRRQKQTKEIEKGARLYVLKKQKESYINFLYLVDLFGASVDMQPAEFLSEYNRILENISENVSLQGFDFLEDEELRKDIEYTRDQLQTIKSLSLSKAKEKIKKKMQLVEKSQITLNNLKIFLESHWRQVYKGLYPSMTYEEVESIVVKTWEGVNPALTHLLENQQRELMELERKYKEQIKTTHATMTTCSWCDQDIPDID